MSKLGYLPVAVVGVVMAAVPIVLGDSRYFLRLAILLVVLATYAVGFNVLFGLSGQLFLCIGALAGVSAYVAVVLATRYGLPIVASVPIGVACSAALGGLLSWIAVRRRLQVIFVGIVTLAFSLVFTNLLLGGRSLTGGETGLVVEGVVPAVLRSQVTAYYVLLGVMLGCLTFYRWMERSRLGWALRASRDDEAAAELAGIDVARHRVLAGAIGASMLGTTGALYAMHDGFISPTSFGFGQLDVRVLVVLAFGGIGTMLGPVAGAAVITVVDELLRPLGQLRLTVYGLVLVVLFLRLPNGLVPAVSAALRRAARPLRLNRGGSCRQTSRGGRSDRRPG